jgi:hypothetical protein
MLGIKLATQSRLLGNKPNEPFGVWTIIFNTAFCWVNTLKGSSILRFIIYYLGGISYLL